MKIVLASALFPPDTAASAAYMKELSARLAADYAVTAVVYGDLPEEVPGVTIIAVSKRRPIPLRLIAFTASLFKALQQADVLYIENGASVELPALIATTFRRLPVILHYGDAVGRARTQRHLVSRLAERLLDRRARTTLEISPLPRPEILPFAPRPEAQFASYERSWNEHIGKITSLFAHAA